MKYKINLNGVSSRNNLPKIKYCAYARNLDEYKSIGTHWIAIYMNSDNAIYFDRFEVGTYSKRNKKSHR